ncbi:hypothetical protein ACQUSR_14765 [Streptomyces sp. P1-3]|uniref:hypothetical protein n=1 Tax=Streptomyces sp. P1-3 TaxID=3421658 RepID=UPI003D3670C4
MGWTHDYRDAPRDRGSDVNTTTTGHLLGSPPGRSRQDHDHDPRIGIPRIIRRRARWVSARLRHPRSR